MFGKRLRMLPIDPNSNRTRILLIDDSDLIRESLRMLVEPSCEVVGESRNGHDAIIDSQRLRPDVALLDISLPDSNGFNVVQDIARCSPSTRTIFVSTHRSPAYKQEALRLGASGYVVKDYAHRDLLPTIRMAVSGASPSPAIPSGSNSVGALFPDSTVKGHKPLMDAMERGQVALQTLRASLSLSAEARDLLDGFAEAARLVLKLLQEQFDAVISGDLTANRFDILIQEANDQKQDAKCAYLHHLQTHGCDFSQAVKHSRS